MFRKIILCLKVISFFFLFTPQVNCLECLLTILQTTFSYLISSCPSYEMFKNKIKNRRHKKIGNCHCRSIQHLSKFDRCNCFHSKSPFRFFKFGMLKRMSCSKLYKFTTFDIVVLQM
jgi:hypothetical protein